MNKVDQLTVPLMQRPLDECSEEELHVIAQQYPWFGPAQLMYAKKLQAGDPGAYREQVEKTSLYFSNRLWLQYLLKEDAEGSDIEPGLSEDRPNYSEIRVGPTAVTDADKPEAEPILTGEEDSPNETDPVEGTALPELPTLKIPFIKTETMDTSIPLAFEPYHTVDYFASQGIKFREEDKPADRFGHQLKSFTEWLKTLKRAPASEMDRSSDPAGEKKVEQLAEHSLAERHVTTEAMAEVWVKQGNKARAEEIYRKLSLLEPAKTAYFAAKIEELKKTS